jgi:hypothetical protein
MLKRDCENLRAGENVSADGMREYEPGCWSCGCVARVWKKKPGRRSTVLLADALASIQHAVNTKKKTNREEEKWSGASNIMGGRGRVLGGV